MIRRPFRFTCPSVPRPRGSPSPRSIRRSSPSGPSSTRSQPCPSRRPFRGNICSPPSASQGTSFVRPLDLRATAQGPSGDVRVEPPRDLLNLAPGPFGPPEPAGAIGLRIELNPRPEDEVEAVVNTLRPVPLDRREVEVRPVGVGRLHVEAPLLGVHRDHEAAEVGPHLPAFGRRRQNSAPVSRMPSSY